MSTTSLADRPLRRESPTSISAIAALQTTERVKSLKRKMLEEERFLSLEQALIITEVYEKDPTATVPVKRAKALVEAMHRMAIAIDPEELIVGNRTVGVRAGVVFPEAGISWIDKEIEGLPTRPQDRFNIRPQDVTAFRERVLPYWRGKSLEDSLRREAGPELDAIAQGGEDQPEGSRPGPHLPGHGEVDRSSGRPVCAARPWSGSPPRPPSSASSSSARPSVLDGASHFMRRYAERAREMAQSAAPAEAANLREVARICDEAGAGRAPRPSARRCRRSGSCSCSSRSRPTPPPSRPGGWTSTSTRTSGPTSTPGGSTSQGALELVEALWLKFNQIVYLRNSHSADYFAGFPIGFNVALGGQDERGEDCFQRALLPLPQGPGAHRPAAAQPLGPPLREDARTTLARRVHAGHRPGQRHAAGVQRREHHPGARGAGHLAPTTPELRHRRLRGAHHARQQPGLERRGHVQPGQGARADAERRRLPADREAARARTSARSPTSAPTRSWRRPSRAQIDIFIERMIRPATWWTGAARASSCPRPCSPRSSTTASRRASTSRAGGAHYNLSGIQAIQAGQRRRQPRRRQEAGLRRARS